ncbi:hypothetical protein GONAM_02_00230 [Gordonia namibiensis NBRC 108229]|uniref:Uncharacterized protein n=1 Tax=Gordonia namibiensis NBRC 108229 TaxID=1208314 RepID=K6WXG4_9ACTN|nr:hypothetical protein GONAM_02_00230 [Gordonia namibiensis NBRC 108229]
MLARIALASDALSVGGLPPAVANQLHEGLLREIQSHGRLIFLSAPERNALVRAVKSEAELPHTARARWIETLVFLHKQQRISVGGSEDDDTLALASVRTLNDLRRVCAGHVEVAIVSDAASLPLGLPEDTGLLTDHQAAIEVATPAAVTTSHTLAKHRRRAERGFSETGSSRDSFWDDVLKPMADGARSATVLDGYLFRSLWDMEDNKPWTRNWRTEQVVWLLRNLDSVMAPGAEVRLISSRGQSGGRDVPTTADIIYGEWEPPTSGSLGRVSISVWEGVGSKLRFPHDRHIRFNYGVALQFASGLDRLRETRITDPDGMSWQYRWDSDAVGALRASERRALALPGIRTEVVVERD